MATTKEFKIKITEQGAKKVANSAEKMENSFRRVGAAITSAIAVIGVAQLARLGMEMTKLTATAQGLRVSMQNLAAQEGKSAVELMRELREVTHGTVTEIELMRAATQAKYLGIDLKNLPVLFEFAAKRAKDTGQQIDYLVESIVLGIGRKSPLILDNLGIQMKDLNREVKNLAVAAGTWTGKIDESTRALYFQDAAVKIAKEGIAESKATFDDVNDSLSQMNREWENFQIVIGSIISGPTAAGLKFINTMLKEMGLNLDTVVSSGLEKGIAMAKLDLEKYNAEIAALDKRIQGAMFLRMHGVAAEHMQRQTQLREDIKITEDYIATLEKLINKEKQSTGGGSGGDEKNLEVLSLKTRDFRELLQGVQYEFGEVRIKAHESIAGIVDDPMWENMKSNINQLTSGIRQAFVLQWREGQSALKGFENAFISTIQSMAAEILSRAAIFALLSLIPGAGQALQLGGFSSFIFGGFKAKGGPALPGHQYVMNEKSGGEVFVPNEPGRIEQQKNISLVIQTSDPKSFETWMRENDGGRMLQRLIAEA